MKNLLVLLFWLSSFALICAQSDAEMNNEKLGKILDSMSDTLEGNYGNWQFLVDSIPMFCLTDEFHNRMRIVSPVKAVKDLSVEEMKKCMEANFHTALDVKYAISEEIVWVAFIHPLKELTHDQAMDAIIQVYNATLTFGTLYSSTDLIFPKREKEKKKKQLKKS